MFSFLKVLVLPLVDLSKILGSLIFRESSCKFYPNRFLPKLFSVQILLNDLFKLLNDNDIALELRI